MAYIDQDPTTQVLYHITPNDEDYTVLLHYVIWSFGPCISGFKYCKPVINIDGTHLYGKYQGECLVAMATDANNKVFPLALLLWIVSQGPVGGGFPKGAHQNRRNHWQFMALHHSN